MQRLMGITLGSWLLLATAALAGISARLEAVLDGDNLLVRSGEHFRQVNLSYVSPPLGDGWDLRTKKRLKELLPRGEALRLDLTWGDSGYHIFAEVYTTKGELINLRLVREGYAVVQRRWLNGQVQQKYLQAEAEAKSDQAGVWQVADSR